MRKSPKFMFHVLLVLLIGAIAHAQLPDQQMGFGTVPYQTFLSEKENINLGTGNLNVHIPLLNLPGRGGHDFGISLSYNSQLWSTGSVIDGLGNTHYYWFPATAWQWSL